MSHSELINLTIAEARDKLARREFFARELVEAHIAAMDATRPLNAYVTETAEKAMEAAKRSDDRRDHIREIGGSCASMEGIPIAIKDMFCTEGVPSTACSKILKGFVPAYESTVSANLLRHGSIMLGKVSNDEFAMGSSNTTSAFGAVKNPWKRADDAADLVPGGSSGGSAVAVASRAAMCATGTDTGGSIRQPAAFCGIAGLKPTYGRCSRWGIVAFASSLDQAGPMARTARDCAIMLEAMAGFDPKDSTSVDKPVPNFEAALTGEVKGLKIGVPKEYRAPGMTSEIEALWEQGIAWLKDAGAEIVEVSLPHTKYALPAYYIIAPAEASSNLARYDGLRYGQRVSGANLTEMYENSRGEGFGPEVKRRILMGTYVLSAGYYDAYYRQAQKVRRLVSNDFSEAFQKCDALLTPTTPTPAFAIGENADDPLAMYLNDVLTVTVNLAGLPGMSVPAGLDQKGLPLGLQIVGRAWDEETVLRIGDVIEQQSGFNSLPAGLAKL